MLRHRHPTVSEKENHWTPEADWETRTEARARRAELAHQVERQQVDGLVETARCGELGAELDQRAKRVLDIRLFRTLF